MGAIYPPRPLRVTSTLSFEIPKYLLITSGKTVVHSVLAVADRSQHCDRRHVFRPIEDRQAQRGLQEELWDAPWSIPVSALDQCRTRTFLVLGWLDFAPLLGGDDLVWETRRVLVRDLVSSLKSLPASTINLARQDHPGQGSPIESSTSRASATGDRPVGGSCFAIPRARSRGGVSRDG